MKLRTLMIALALAALASILVAAAPEEKKVPQDTELSRIIRGYQIAPVKLITKGRDRDLLGLGSFIVNAQAACNDCHTHPPFVTGGDPFQGAPEQMNSTHFLAGARALGRP